MAVGGRIVSKLGTIMFAVAILIGTAMAWTALGPAAVAQPAAMSDARPALTPAELSTIPAKTRTYLTQYEQEIARTRGAATAGRWNSLVLNFQSRLNALNVIINRQLPNIRAGRAATAAGAPDLGAVRKNFIEVVAERDAVLAIQPRAVAAANQFRAEAGSRQAAAVPPRPNAPFPGQRPAVASGPALAQAGVAPPGSLAPGACAAPARPGAAPRNPPLNLGGLKLGMTPSQVRQILTCQGTPFAVRDQRENMRLGQRTYDYFSIRAQRGGNLAMRGGPAREEIKIDFAGPQGRETVMRLAMTIDYPEDVKPNYDAVWAELDRTFGRVEPGLKPSNKDSAAIVMDYKGARMSNLAYSYDLCASFAWSPSGSINFVGANIEQPTDCGLIYAHSIVYEINDPTRVARVSFGTVDYGQTVRAVYAGAGVPAPYLGPTNKRPLPVALPLPRQPAPFKGEPNPPRVCYRLQTGLQQCSDLALNCNRACVFGGPADRGACRSQCTANRGMCETDARGRAAVSTCPG